jgi:hypothetical protein
MFRASLAFHFFINAALVSRVASETRDLFWETYSGRPQDSGNQMAKGGTPKMGLVPSKTTKANNKVTKGIASLSTYFSPIQIMRKEVRGWAPRKKNSNSSWHSQKVALLWNAMPCRRH